MYLTEEQIKNRVKTLSLEITQDLSHVTEPILAIGVLNGCLHFFSDLTRDLYSIGINCINDFVAVKSYENNQKSDSLKMLYEPKITLKDKRVLLIEDIADSGDTIKFLKKYLYDSGVTAVYTVCLLKRTSCPESIDYCGFEITDDAYVVGYGLDNNQLDRNCKDIFKLN